jgi:hypothetical protein
VASRQVYLDRYGEALPDLLRELCLGLYRRFLGPLYERLGSLPGPAALGIEVPQRLGQSLDVGGGGAATAADESGARARKLDPVLGEVLGILVVANGAVDELGQTGVGVGGDAPDFGDHLLDYLEHPLGADGAVRADEDRTRILRAPGGDLTRHPCR